MKYFRPGDMVQVVKDLSYTFVHPNQDRKLKKGDYFLVVLVSSGVVAYKSWRGPLLWLSDDLLDWFPKGNSVDCLNFLDRTGRKPLLFMGQWSWGMLGFGQSLLYMNHLIPHYIFRHMPYNGGNNADHAVVGGLKYFKTVDEAYHEAGNAWLKMTPSQQAFLNGVNYLEEVYP